MKKIVFAVFVFILVAPLVSCGSNKAKDKSDKQIEKTKDSVDAALKKVSEKMEDQRKNLRVELINSYLCLQIYR